MCVGGTAEHETVRIRLAVGCVIVTALAGCASTASAQEAEQEIAKATLPCATATGAGDDRGRGPTKSDIVVGPPELVSIKRYARYPRRHFKPKRDRDFSAKVQLTIASGARVRLAIAPRWRRHTSLFYADSTRKARRVKGGHSVLDFQACADAERTFWSGGLKVDGARCVRLRVTVNNADTRTLRIALGKGMCKSRERVAS